MVVKLVPVTETERKKMDHLDYTKFYDGYTDALKDVASICTRKASSHRETLEETADDSNGISLVSISSKICAFEEISSIASEIAIHVTKLYE